MPSRSPQPPKEAVEALADELMLYRFGGQLVEGRYHLKLNPDEFAYYRPQAIDNARRILREDRLAIRKQERQRVREVLEGDEFGDRLIEEHERSVNRIGQLMRDRTQVEAERDQAIQARREIESKLASGYSLCHPEDDCEGQRAWMKAAAERDELLEAATKRSLVGHPELKTVVDCIQASRRPGGEPRQGGER